MNQRNLTGKTLTFRPNRKKCKKKKSVKGGKRLNPPLTFSLVKQIMQGGKHMDTCDNDSFI